MKQAVVVAALLSAACGLPLMKLPSGPGTPVPGAASAYAEAIAACSAVRTLTAEIGISGSAGGRRLRVRLFSGVAPPASVRLEAITSFGPPLFIFVAKQDDATLLLPRDDRMLQHGQPSAVLDALAGIPLDAADLVALLTGCAPEAERLEARQFGETWQVASIDGDEWYLHRESARAPWQLVATVHRAVGNRRWRAEFRDRQAGVPRASRITSLAASDRAGAAFDLQLALLQVEINTPLGADVFTVRIPASAGALTLDELRRSGPLGPTGADGR